LSKKRSGIQTFFSTTTYAELPNFRTLLWKTVYFLCQSVLYGTHLRQMIVGRKEDEAGDGWILSKDNDDFMRIVQKIKAAPNASAFINSSDAGLLCLTLFLCFFFFCRRGCFIFCSCG
jgi:hypothetical protein